MSENSESEGSGSHHDHGYDEQLINSKDFLYTSDDEDFVEGSGDIADISDIPESDDVGSEIRESTESSEPDHLTEEESKIR